MYHLKLRTHARLIFACVICLSASAFAGADREAPAKGVADAPTNRQGASSAKVSADEGSTEAATRVAINKSPAVRRARVFLAWMAGKDEQLKAQGKASLEKETEAVQYALLQEALRHKSPVLRSYAAKRLSNVSVPKGFKTLLTTALRDTDPSVRVTAAKALKHPAYSRAVHVFGRGLFTASTAIQRRSLAALTSIGDELAVGYIVQRWEKRSGDFTRVYFMQMNQLGYIQDFDVEVASTSFIADPVVGVLQEGVLQDVRILATSQEGTTVRAATYRRALSSIAGIDKGAKVSAWRKYWDTKKHDLATKRANRLRTANRPTTER